MGARLETTEEEPILLLTSNYAERITVAPIDDSFSAYPLTRDVVGALVHPTSYDDSDRGRCGYPPCDAHPLHVHVCAYVTDRPDAVSRQYVALCRRHHTEPKEFPRAQA